MEEQYDDGGFLTNQGDNQGDDQGVYPQYGSYEGEENTVKKPEKNKDSENLIPLSITQILQSTFDESETELYVDNRQIGIAKIVGEIVKKNFNSYTINDGFNEISARKYGEKEDSENSYNVGDWVVVFGQPKKLQGKFSIAVWRMKKITDKNEITYHFLNVIRTHLYNTKGPLPPLPEEKKDNKPQQQQNQNQYSTTTTTSNYNDNNYNNNQNNQNQNQNQYYQGNQYQNNQNNYYSYDDEEVAPIQSEILGFVKSNPGGVKNDVIIDFFKKKYKIEDVKSAIHLLKNEGTLFVGADVNTLMCSE